MAAWWRFDVRAAFGRWEGSAILTLVIVFLTNLLDNLLLTAVVPIIPDYLLNLDEEDLASANASVTSEITSSNTSMTPVMTSANISGEEGGFRRLLSGLTVAPVSENSRVGWLLSAKAIAQLIANPAIGPLSARIGYPVVLTAGCSVLTLSSLIFAVAPNYPLLFLARTVQGFGSAATTIAGMSILAHIYPEDQQRSRTMGMAMGGSAVGIVVGYPFGGILYTFIGKLVPFLIVACILLFDIFLQWVVLRPSLQTATAVTATPLLTLLRDPYILVVSGAVMCTTMAMAILEPTVPLWIMESMKVEKWQLGLVFLPDSIGYFLGTNFFGVAAMKIGRWSVTMGCMIMIGVCLFCIPLTSELPELVVPHFGLGFGLGVTDAALMPMLALLVDARHEAFYGSVYAIAQLAVCLAYSVGPSFAGQVVKAIGFNWLMRGMAIVNLVYCPLCVFLRHLPSSTEETVILSGGTTGEKYTKEVKESGFGYGKLHEDD